MVTLDIARRGGLWSCALNSMSSVQAYEGLRARVQGGVGEEKKDTEVPDEVPSVGEKAWV